MKHRAYDTVRFQKLLDKAKAAITELEAQNEGDDDPTPTHLPKQLRPAARL